MKPIRLITAALIASASLAFTLPASAAPKAAPAGAVASEVIPVGYWDRDASRWTDRDSRDRRYDRRYDRRDARHDARHDDRRDDRRDWRRDDRRDDRRDARRDDRRDHYRDYGRRHDSYRGYRHWRADHHPRYRYWAGRPVPRVQYVVIDRYDDYYLPPPRRGHYYVRSGSDIYLVAAATHLIVDAFMLLDAAHHN